MKSNSCESCFATNFRNTVFDESTIIQATVIISIRHLFVSVCQLQFGRIEIKFWEAYANSHAANHYNDNYNEHDGLSNHQTHVCLRNRLFRRRWNKYQSTASLAFVRGIYRWPMNSPLKGPVTRKCFHLMTSSCTIWSQLSSSVYTLSYALIAVGCILISHRISNLGISGTSQIVKLCNFVTEVAIIARRATV